MANKNIPIIRLKGSDIISQSMNIINQNFDTIVNNYDIANFKWEQYSKKITDEIEKLKRHCDKSNIDITRSVDSLNTRIDNITDLNDIQTQINNAIMNANLELTGFISDLAGQQVANAMGGYVKTSALDSKLKGYVASSAFETYKSDAKNRTASSSLIVANSKFATIKDNGVDYLMNLDGTKSIYKNTEEYWNAIKDTVDQTGKGLEDEEIFNKFLQKCEETFRTVSTELANISAKVGPESAQVDIIAAVNGENGKQISASIFAKANETDSEITLNADKILINSGKTLNVQSGGNINIESGGSFQVNSNNFKIDSSGNVTVKGAIEATSLKINGTSGLIDISDETKLSNFIKSHQDTASGDVEWLKNALNNGTTTIDGGLVLSNAILTKDSNDNITAGMIGENTSGNDVRFFAGSNDFNSRESSPFRVYKSGKLIAKDTEITGKITASSGTIGGLNIHEDGSLTTDNGNFSLSYDGVLTAKMGSFGGFLKMPFKSFDEGATYNSSDQTYTVSNSFNLQSIASHWSDSYKVTLKLPSSSTFSGSVLTIFDSPVKTRSSPGLIITCEQNAYIYHPSRTSSTYGLAPATSIYCTRGGVIQFVCVNQGSYNYWVVISDAMPEAEIS